jgi:hypothetical protein
MVSGVSGRLNILEKIIFSFFYRRKKNKEKEIIFFCWFIFILFFSYQRFGEMPVYHFVSNV